MYLLVFTYRSIDKTKNDPTTRYNGHLTKIIENFLSGVLESECNTVLDMFVNFASLSLSMEDKYQTDNHAATKRPLKE